MENFRKKIIFYTKDPKVNEKTNKDEIMMSYLIIEKYR